jgi:hypothetical protein
MLNILKPIRATKGRKPRAKSAANNRVTVRLTSAEFDSLVKRLHEGESLASCARRLILK